MPDDSDDDSSVEVVRTTGNVAMRDYPHPRHSCLEHPFCAGAGAAGRNLTACANCWCFVCEAKWGECASWQAHCDATDSDPRWLAERNSARRARERTSRRADDARPEARESRQARDDQSRAAEESRWLNHENSATAGAGADEEVEELFQEYEPQLAIVGLDKHPTTAFETTSLSFVRTPDVDPNAIKLAARVAAGSGTPSEGALSSLQMQTVALAVTRHEQTLPGSSIAAGFFLGDGPGVGKGRQVAAIIYEHYLRGRTNHVWISTSNDLLDDALRDVREIGCPLKVYRLNSLTAKQLREPPEGILFCTYSTLIAREAGEAGRKAAARRSTAARATAGGEEEEEEYGEEEQALDGADDEEDDELRAAASRGPARKGRGARHSVDTIAVDLDPTRRLTQIVNWLKQGGKGKGDGAVVFDESHRAKNLCPDGGVQTVTGLAVLELQAALPSGKVVYCSATGCSSVKGMAYMTRLGLWGANTPFDAFASFEHAISKGGPGAMELVALDMKQRGMYLSRMLSYHECDFETVEIEPDERFRRIYDAAVGFWRVAFECCQHAFEELMQIGLKPKRGLMSQFWGTHQRFYKQLCMSIKVPELVRRAKAALSAGHAVVIGLQSTGEARLADAVRAADSEDDLEEFRGLRALLEQFLTRFPCREALAVRSDPDAPDTAAKGGAMRPVKASAAGSALPSARVRTPRWVQAQKDAAAAGSGVGAAAGSDDDSDDSDDGLDVIADMQGIKAAKDAFKRRCELELPLDDLKQLWSAMVGGCAGNAPRPPPTKKEALVAVLGTAFADVCKLDRDELRQRLVQCGVPRARVPKARRERIEALWRARAGDRLGAVGAAGGSAGGAGPGKAKAKGGGSDDDDDDDADMSAGERSIWRRLAELKGRMLDALEKLELPENPLDQIIADLGGVNHVAELTGRKMRRVWEGNQMTLRARNCDLRTAGKSVPMAQVNNREKEEFLNDVKRVAIISEAASSGISLHADERFTNKRRRVHMTIELAWSADEAIQQFGRTHRSNQISAPSYVLLMSTIGGERRFASSVAKRLQALGALTKGDRRASDAANLEVFNFEHIYGTKAVNDLLDMMRHPLHAAPSSEVLDAVLAPKEHLKARMETAPGPALRKPENQQQQQQPTPDGKGPARAADDGGSGGEEEDGAGGSGAGGSGAGGSGAGGSGAGGSGDGDAAERRRDEFEAYLAELEDGLAAAGIDVGDDKWETKTLSVVTFMNRMLGLPVELQGKAFAHFSASVDLLIKRAKEVGSFDAGIGDLNARYIRVRDAGQALREEKLSGARAVYYELEVDNGMSWTARESEYQYRLALLGGEVGLSGSYEARFAPDSNNGKHLPHMIVRVPRPPFATSTYVPMYRNYTPHRGFTRLFSEEQVKIAFRPVVDPAAAKLQWEQHFEHALKGCLHGPCCSRQSRDGGACVEFNRVTLVHFVSGCILPLWHELAVILNVQTAVSASAGAKYLKICRVRINAGEMKGRRLVGIKLQGFSWQQRMANAGFNIKITKTDFNGQPTDGGAPLTRDTTQGSPQALRRERAARSHRRSLAKQPGPKDAQDLINDDEQAADEDGLRLETSETAAKRKRAEALADIAERRKRASAGTAGGGGVASGSILPHLQHARKRVIADDEPEDDGFPPPMSLSNVADF